MDGFSQSPSNTAVLSERDAGFIGSHDLTFDDKGRLTVPARFKTLLLRKYTPIDAETTRVIVVAWPDPQFPCARIYPVGLWDRLVQHFRQASDFDRNIQALRRLLYARSCECEVDSAGRIRIERRVLDRAGIGKKVIMLGQGEHFEIWDEERLENWINATDKRSDALQDAALSMMTKSATDSTSAGTV